MYVLKREAIESFMQVLSPFLMFFCTYKKKEIKK